jgi:fumarate hydratase, class II
MSTRTERDSIGAIEVPEGALWGAQTQRALNHFQIAGAPLPSAFIRALGHIKCACAQVNGELGALDSARADAIEAAARAVANGAHADQFPIDVLQTGSGTSTNMNLNEVLAALAARASGLTVHPNDHVNIGQSSNDVIPTAIAVSAALAVQHELKPALQHLQATLAEKIDAIGHIVKTGRTHLMDALPLTFAQELGGFSAQIGSCLARLDDALKRVRLLPLGGTAIGTGVNADPRFAAAVVARLSQETGFQFLTAPNLFEGIATQDSAVELSGQLNTLAVALMKIANDLRWMNSGPLTGLAEITLKALQPGSSIMPGKVNPVIPEAVCMAAASVMGNHTTMTVAGQSGNFQLNVMLPLIATKLLESIGLLTRAAVALADLAIRDFAVNETRLNEALARNPILVTALNARIGYERGALIAKRALAENRSIAELVAELTDLSAAEITTLLDPRALTQSGTRAGHNG